MATLNIRNVPDDVANRASRAARARRMTLAQYLTALVALHDAARAHADAGDGSLNAELQALGLDTVSA